MNLTKQYLETPQYFDELKSGDLIQNYVIAEVLCYSHQYSCEGNCGDFKNCSIAITVVGKRPEGGNFHCCGEIIRMYNGRMLSKRKEESYVRNTSAHR